MKVSWKDVQVQCARATWAAFWALFPQKRKFWHLCFYNQRWFRWFLPLKILCASLGPRSTFQQAVLLQLDFLPIEHKAGAAVDCMPCKDTKTHFGNATADAKGFEIIRSSVYLLDWAKHNICESQNFFFSSLSMFLAMFCFHARI